METRRWNVGVVTALDECIMKAVDWSGLLTVGLARKPYNRPSRKQNRGSVVYFGFFPHFIIIFDVAAS